MQQNAVQQLLANFLGQAQLGLGTSPFENIITQQAPKRPGFFQSILGTLAPGFGQFGQGFGQAAGSRFGQRTF
jgi:hypothetical protein